MRGDTKGGEAEAWGESTSSLAGGITADEARRRGCAAVVFEGRGLLLALKQTATM